MEVNKLAMIGAGSMGGMMTLLCAEHGIDVHMFDPSADSVNRVLKQAKAARLGLGGCGHYLKMVHNGIEHGMMTALCEPWGVMGRCFGWSHDEVAGVLGRWNTDADSPLRHNFLVGIGAEICRAREPGDK